MDDIDPQALLSILWFWPGEAINIKLVGMCQRFESSLIFSGPKTPGSIINSTFINEYALSSVSISLLRFGAIVSPSSKTVTIFMRFVDSFSEMYKSTLFKIETSSWPIRKGE